MKIEKDTTKGIDKFLKLLQKEGMSYKSDKIVQLCEGIGLIEQKKANQYILTINGLMAINDGGIEKYLEKLGTEKDLDFIIKGLTKKSLKYQVWYNLMYVLIGGILASIPNIVSEYKNSKEETQLYKLEYEKNALNEHSQTDIQQMRSEITSLKNEIDSLKYSQSK